jgi:endogenous inhibitor of DNA gyrase (YacG/DUF329 family)
MDERGPREWPDWPFCSSKCKLVDLGRWLGESYRVPAVEPKSGADPSDPSANPSAARDTDEA